MRELPLTPSLAAPLLARAVLRRLGDLPGHEFHGNQWTSGSAVGRVFAVPSQGRAAWIKQHQQAYDTDPDVRTVADAVTLLTQGSTNAIYAASAGAAGASYEEVWGNSLDMPLSGAAHPLASYKNYFAGQDVEHADHVTLRQAGHVLNKAVDVAPPIPAALHRGMEVPLSRLDAEFRPVPNPRYQQLHDMKVGDTLEMPGVTSFTLDAEKAKEFSTGRAKGQPGYLQARQEAYSSSREAAVTFEVVPGARGLSVEYLSPYKQKEVLTRGTFIVKHVERREAHTRYGKRTQPDLHIVLEQRR